MALPYTQELRKSSSDHWNVSECCLNSNNLESSNIHSLKKVNSTNLSRSSSKVKCSTNNLKASSSNNFKSPTSGMDKYGKQRLKLAVLLRDKILPKNLLWTIENGTLLGAWRNGKFIAHDDDFDFAVYFNKEDVQSKVIELFDHINYTLPEPYKARLVTTYCTKIEVFDPSYGKYTLQGPSYNKADFHHVTADIQAFQLNGEFYHALYNICPQNVVLRASNIFPMGSISLEGEMFNTPCHVEAVLKSIYGSLSINAKYNTNTGRYEDHSEDVKTNDN